MDKQYYWNLLKQATNLEQEEFAHNIPAQVETNNLKTMAIVGLLRLGEKFQIDSNKAEIERLEEEARHKIISDSHTNIPELREVLKLRNLDNTVYSLDLAILKNIMKSEYTTLIEQDNIKESETEANPLDIELPDIFNEDLSAQPQASQTAVPNIQQATLKPEPQDVSRNESYIPNLNGNLNYSRDPEHKKLYDTFCLNQVRMVYENGDQKAVVDFNIYPLAFIDNSPITDIMVVALSGDMLRAGISRGVSAAVQIDFEGLSFMVRGWWEEGKFNTQVNCLDKNFADKFVQQTTEYKPVKRTYTTFMQEELFHKTCSFFPAMIQNNNSAGFTPTAMVYEDNGQLQILLSNEKDSFNMIDNDGLPCSVSLYWSGGKTPVLNLTISDE